MRYLLSAFLLVSLSACTWLGIGHRISGNGQITSQERSAGSFNNVEASGSVTIKVRQGTAQGVKLETDANLMEYIEVYTSGNTLVIRSREGYHLHPSKDIIAYVTAPEFREINVSGACDIIGDGPISGSQPLSMSVSGSGLIDMQVDLPQVSTSVSGSGTVILHGRTTNLDSRVSGSGEIHCFDLATDRASISISGSGEAEVNAAKELDVKVSGSGDVKYKGNGVVKQDISGAGSVVKVG